MMSDVIPTRVARRPSPAVVLELLKPITWFPPMWAFICGVVSSGEEPGAAPPDTSAGPDRRPGARREVAA